MSIFKARKTSITHQDSCSLQNEISVRNIYFVKVCVARDTHGVYTVSVQLVYVHDPFACFVVILIFENVTVKNSKLIHIVQWIVILVSR